MSEGKIVWRSGTIRGDVIERLTPEIARLKAELEEARTRYESWTAEIKVNIDDLKARAETAEAAAGAMREALETAKTFVGTACDPRAPYARIMIEKLDKALSPTIGAEVMRVVRAAEKIGYFIGPDEFRGDHVTKSKTVDRAVAHDWNDALNAFLSPKGAALGGTHER